VFRKPHTKPACARVAARMPLGGAAEGQYGVRHGRAFPRERLCDRDTLVAVARRTCHSAAGCTAGAKEMRCLVPGSPRRGGEPAQVENPIPAGVPCARTSSTKETWLVDKDDAGSKARGDDLVQSGRNPLRPVSTR
jgi:hypothetical protein